MLDSQVLHLHKNMHLSKTSLFNGKTYWYFYIYLCKDGEKAMTGTNTEEYLGYYS